MDRFNVTLVNLTPDLRSAQSGLGTHEMGEMDSVQLTAILEAFRRLDPADALTAEPRLLVETRSRPFTISIAQHVLLLHDARQPLVVARAAEPSGILAEIDRITAANTSPPTGPARRRARWRQGIAVAILLASFGLVGSTIHSYLIIDDISRHPAVQFVSDAGELTALRNSAVGRYTTGNDAGDRRIEIAADGHIRFLRVSSDGARPEWTDTYRIGRLDGKICIVTAAAGLVYVTNIDTIVYYDDTYRRSSPASSFSNGPSRPRAPRGSLIDSPRT